MNSEDDIYATTGAYTLMDIQYVNSDSGISSGLITTLALGVTSTSSSDNSSTIASGTTVAATTTTARSNSAGGRVGGRPFWAW